MTLKVDGLSTLIQSAKAISARETYRREAYNAARARLVQAVRRAIREEFIYR